MPSWLSPRVGAVPQNGQPDRKKKERRVKQPATPKKGITMEDLKKQTALRLAHEQKKRAPESGVKGPSPPAASASSHVQPAIPVHSMYPTKPPGPPIAYGYDLPPPSMAGMVPPPASYGGVYAGQDPLVGPAPTFSTMPPPSVTEPVAPKSHQQREAARDVNTPKLPHGLTVQELKEMTKARLQAEAAKKEQQGTTLVERREQPPPSRPAVSPLPMHAPVPFVQSRSRTHSRDGWSQCGEADEYSVCSTTSDFIGSEAAFGPSPSPSPFVPNRAHLGSYGSLSGTNGPMDNYTVSPLPESVASPAVYGTAQADYYNPNRRRAQTLSPRQGLSHLDEERQVLPGQEFPGMPSFSTPPSNRHYPRYSNRSNVELFTGLPTRPNTVDVNSRAHTFSMGPTSISERVLHSSDWMENRPRTSSAASLPAISHTAEEFFLMEPPQFERSSFHRLSSEIAVVTEEDSARPSVTGLADVFRKSSPPPGFTIAPGGDLVSSTSMTSNGLGLGALPSYSDMGDVRNRASTWAPDSMFRSSSSPPSTGLGMEELAAILKLSEAEDSAQR